MYSLIQKTAPTGAPPQLKRLHFSDQFYSKYYYGRHATLSISNVLPLRRILEGAVVCNVEHHVGDRGTFIRVSRDYVIMISRNLDNGTSTGTLPAEVWPPWLVDVFDISSDLMNWLTRAATRAKPPIGAVLGGFPTNKARLEKIH